MRVKFDRAKLAATLLFVKNAIPTKEVEPILNNFLFTSQEGGVVEIVSTDLDLMSVGHCVGTVEEPGSMAIPGSKLISLISRLTGETISFDCQGSSIKIECGAYHGEFKTPGTESYPAINQITQQEPLAVFKRETVLSGLKRINFAVNDDEAKKQLMAVELSGKGMVATNGKVTAIYREAFNVSKLCISANCLKDLQAVMDASSVENLEIYEEDAYLVFKFGEDVFFTRKTAVDFPDVFGRIDAGTQNNGQLLKFKVKELKSVIQRISLTASEETRSITMTLLTDEDMKISAEDNKDFSSEETLKVVTKDIPNEEGNPYQIRFNYDILLEILSRMSGEEIELKISSNIRTPVRIDEGKVTIFVMRSVL